MGLSVGFCEGFSSENREGSEMLARDDQTSLKHTPLHALHVASGGKMVPFAGYDMPVQYGPGVLREHLHTRSRPACSTSPIWARSCCIRSPARSRTPRGL